MLIICSVIRCYVDIVPKFVFPGNKAALWVRNFNTIIYKQHLLDISINLLIMFYHECCSLIGYATHYLFCVSINLQAFYHKYCSLIGYVTHYLFSGR